VVGDVPGFIISSPTTVRHVITRPLQQADANVAASEIQQAHLQSFDEL